MPADTITGTAPLALGYGGWLDRGQNVLHGGHNAGFFSNCSVTLWNLADAVRREKRWPAAIDFSGAFAPYRNAAQAASGTDLYPLFFAAPSAAEPMLGPPPPRLRHHGLYRFLPYRQLAPAVRHYFTPGAAALSRQAEWVSRYRIDTARTIAVCYRGTDKGSEVTLAEPAAYLRQAQALLQRHPGHRVWIQTDDAQVRDLFVRTLGDRCFYLEELPVSSSGSVIHGLGDEALQLDRSEFGIRLVAVTHLLSQAAIVVNHTGNMAVWICLWRGHARGVIQFDETGGLVDLASPAFYARQALHLLHRVKRKLFGRRR